MTCQMNLQLRVTRFQEVCYVCPTSRCLSHVITSPILAFKAMTSGDFTVKMLPGSHFYLKDGANEKVILDYITKHLETAEMDYL